jgi:aryl-alcohol dehydrogenase-like predicted oxidoreductase
MQYRKLGRIGLKVSAICLGTMTYGRQITDQDPINLIEHAMAAGVYFFDTADTYIQGKYEEVVGKALQKVPESVVLATKVAHKSGAAVRDSGLFRKHLVKGTQAPRFFYGRYSPG